MKFNFLFFFLILPLYLNCIYVEARTDSNILLLLMIDGESPADLIKNRKLLTKDEIMCDIKGETKCEPSEGMRALGVSKKSDKDRPLRWAICQMGDNMACEAKLEHALLEAIRTCATLQTEALDCCHAPEECVGGSLAHALDSLGKMNTAIGAMKGGQAHCDAIQQTHGMYGGMQGVMASQCRTKAGACTRDCNQKLAPVTQAFEEACGVGINSGTSHKESYTCDKTFFNHYIGMYKGKNEKEINIAQVPEECKRTGKEANRRIQDMGTNLGASLMASAQECEAMAQENGWDTTNWGTTGGDYQPGPTVYTTTASTTGASESVGGSTGSTGGYPGSTGSTGSTGGYPGTDGSTMGVSSTDGGGADPTNPLVNPDTPGDVAQIPGLNLGGGGNKEKNKGMPFGDMNIQQAANPFDTEPTMEEANSALGGDVNAQDLTGGLIGGTGGGSSGGGGLGGAGGGGSGGGGRYGAYGARKPAQVALGLKSGGKFKGYGGGGNKSNPSKRSRARKKGKKDPKNFASLDLKKLLPKGKQINHKTGKYGSPHDNIFKRMSDRIQWMCRKERIDCR